MLRMLVTLFAFLIALPAYAHECNTRALLEELRTFTQDVRFSGPSITALVDTGQLVTGEHSEVWFRLDETVYVLSLESLKQHIFGDNFEIVNHRKKLLIDWIGTVETAMHQYDAKPLAGIDDAGLIWLGAVSPSRCVGNPGVPAIPAEWLYPK